MIANGVPVAREYCGLLLCIPEFLSQALKTLQGFLRDYLKQALKTLQGLLRNFYKT